MTSTPSPSPSPDPDRLRIVVPRYGPRVIGGVETLARQLARSLHGGGWQVEVWTTCAVDAQTWANAGPPGTAEEEGIRVRRFAVRRRRAPAAFRQASRVFFRLPPRLRPERAWIVAQGPYTPGLIAALAAAPASPTLFMPYLYFPTLRGLSAAAGARLMLPAAHDELPLRLRAVGGAVATAGGLLYSTEEERALLERAHPVARDKPSAVGAVGVDPPPLPQPQRFRRRLGLEGDYLLYGGRATPGKGLEELLAGMSVLRQRHPDAQLVLTGEAGQAAPPQPGVVRAGRLAEEERWDAIAGAAAVVVPSFHESLSLLALEAWSLGRPALLNAASPALAGQGARSGAAMTYRGAGELAAAAASLLTDRGRAAALGEAGRGYVAATYRWELVHERLRRLIAGAEAGDGRAV
ncbi:MAG: glycosyltransferase family 4 protein [Chloroflexi bacterium]|nr:MAG: glycosyltransferase family 4 protein [Chloroflexota bacterium]